MTSREAVGRVEPNGVFNVARCPNHGPFPAGLHGERDTCFDCGAPVEQVPMVPVAGIEKARGAAAALVRGPSRSPETLECADALIDQARELGQEILDALTSTQPLSSSDLKEGQES